MKTSRGPARRSTDPKLRTRYRGPQNRPRPQPVIDVDHRPNPVADAYAQFRATLILGKAPNWDIACSAPTRDSE